MAATQQPDDPLGAPPPATKGPSGPRAGFWTRFGAAILDGIIISIPYFIVVTATDNAAVANAANLLTGIVYYTYFEGSAAGQTIGKKALGIRVIDLAGGGSIGHSRAFIRYLGRIVSAIVLLLGYLWMLWDDEKQTWHDKMAGSVVVPVSSYPVG